MPADPAAPLKPADSDDPLQRVLPLMVDAQGEHDLHRWARVTAEWVRRQQVITPAGQRWTKLQAGESVEADVMAGRL